MSAQSARSARSPRFPRLSHAIAFVVVSAAMCALAGAPVHASCHDRPGTPAAVSASGASMTTIRLDWRNTASEGFAPGSPILEIPYSAWLQNQLLPHGAIYFDFYVRKDSPNGPSVGQDVAGYGPFESYESAHHRLFTYFPKLAAGTTYCFQMRARTEPGSQGCVSQKASNWSCAATTTPPVPVKPPIQVPSMTRDRLVPGTGSRAAAVFRH